MHQLGGPHCHKVWYGKNRMASLSDGEKILRIWLLVLTQYMDVTDGYWQTDRPHDGRGRAYAQYRAAKNGSLTNTLLKNETFSSMLNRSARILSPYKPATSNWTIKLEFLSRISTAMLTCDIDAEILSARLSVRHVPVFYRNSLTYHHTFFSTHGSSIIPVIPVLNIFAKFRRGHRAGVYKFRHFRWETTTPVMARSSQIQHVYVSRTITITYGSRSFAVSGPRVWSDLPPTLRSSSTTLGQFQSRLKTTLFRLAYGMWLGAFVMTV